MDKEEQEHKQFLDQQLQWYKEQDRILVEIETKLYEMKRIAQYTLDHELNPVEINQLNDRLKELTSEVQFLEEQLYTVVH